MYRYDDSSANPFCYTENLFLRVFNITKNSFQVQSVYETNNLFKRAKVFLEGTYLNDKSYDFYGFNGIASRFDQRYEDQNSPEYFSNNFYSVHRQLMRFRFDYQRYIKSENLRMLTGISFQNYKFSDASEGVSLFDKYVAMGLIPDSEAKGGFNTSFTIGIVYDKRDNQCYCSDGQWLESFVIFSPKKLSSESFTKYVLTYRTYREILRQKFVLMARGSVQTLLNGTLPSYMLTNYYDTKLNQDGIGGAFTLRGVNRNRIAADGFALINNELVMEEYKDKFFNSEYSPYFGTVGGGLYFILNRNNVISINYGLPVNHRESKGGLYIGSSFLF